MRSATIPSPVIAVLKYQFPLLYLLFATATMPPPIFTHLVAYSGRELYTNMPLPGSSYTQPPVVFTSSLIISMSCSRISEGILSISALSAATWSSPCLIASFTSCSNLSPSAPMFLFVCAFEALTAFCA